MSTGGHPTECRLPPRSGRCTAVAVEGGGAAVTVQGLPLLKPLLRLDLGHRPNKGEIAWQVAHGRNA